MATSYGTSSLNKPSTIEEVIIYIKKRLGAPVVQINVADEQIEDRIMDALNFISEYNEDFTEKTYIPHLLTQDNIDSNSVPTANNVFEVTRVLSPTNIDKNIMTDITYAMRHNLNFNEFMRSAYVGQMTEYNLMMMKMQEITDTFIGVKSLRFNRYTGVINWNGKMNDFFKVGDYFVYECYVIIDPEEFGAILGDRKFLALATAYVKKSWGEILTKFSDVKMLGGVTLNASGILQQGNADVEKAEQDIISSSVPAMDYYG